MDTLVEQTFCFMDGGTLMLTAAMDKSRAFIETKEVDQDLEAFLGRILTRDQA